ncbi:uncharacterized protein LOC119105583 [Pollicipes pollicipes]|uniref:uncharacterized protein LOC119105583 n=1 Tax=Pollicipes pollicipes TaxID=41117 RepID=UPI0018855A02|nr:uncharacterized protein LOC119105583 [Pollicipes pollicipes]
MAGSDMSVDDIYERLRLSFPFVHVRRADARDTPELARLLLSLARHVDETGVSRSVASELQTEQRRLAQQLHGYHATRLLHTLLEEMATGLSAAGDHTDHQQLAAYQTAGQQFTALAQRYRQLCRELDHQRWLIAEMDALADDSSAATAAAAAEGGAEQMD